MVTKEPPSDTSFRGRVRRLLDVELDLSSVRAGQTAHVHMTVNPRDLSYVNEAGDRIIFILRCGSPRAMSYS
jgi:hypothetical protein